MQSMSETKRPVRLFYSYSHKDEALRDELITHLTLMKRQGEIAPWHDRAILAGDDWKGQIDKNLEEADIVLLLVSPDFLASDYCYDIELGQALKRHEQGLVRVLPIILRPVVWGKAPFARFQALPRDGKAVVLWPNRDEAWVNVAQGIAAVVKQLQAMPNWAATNTPSPTATNAPSPAASNTPSPAALRRFLIEIFVRDQDFMDFCSDHFREVYRQVTGGMELGQKIRLLLDVIHRDRTEAHLLILLKKDYPVAYERHEALLG
jgi:hypothetical protein